MPLPPREKSTGAAGLRPEKIGEKNRYLLTRHQPVPPTLSTTQASSVGLAVRNWGFRGGIGERRPSFTDGWNCEKRNSSDLNLKNFSSARQGSRFGRLDGTTGQRDNGLFLGFGEFVRAFSVVTLFFCKSHKAEFLNYLIHYFLEPVAAHPYRAQHHSGTPSPVH